MSQSKMLVLVFVRRFAIFFDSADFNKHSGCTFAFIQCERKRVIGLASEVGKLRTFDLVDRSELASSESALQQLDLPDSMCKPKSGPIREHRKRSQISVIQFKVDTFDISKHRDNESWLFPRFFVDEPEVCLDRSNLFQRESKLRNKARSNDVRFNEIFLAPDCILPQPDPHGSDDCPHRAESCGDIPEVFGRADSQGNDVPNKEAGDPEQQDEDCDEKQMNYRPEALHA